MECLTSFSSFTRDEGGQETKKGQGEGDDLSEKADSADSTKVKGSDESAAGGEGETPVVDSAIAAAPQASQKETDAPRQEEPAEMRAQASLGECSASKRTRAAEKEREGHGVEKGDRRGSEGPADGRTAAGPEIAYQLDIFDINKLKLRSASHIKAHLNSLTRSLVGVPAMPRHSHIPPTLTSPIPTLAHCTHIHTGCTSV